MEGSRKDFKGQDFELIPSGAGRRIYPGMNFGIAAVELALAIRKLWTLPDANKKL